MHTLDYKVGDIVWLTDNIDIDTKVRGTIRLVEQDSEYGDLYWIYIKANDEDLNNNYDIRIGDYFAIVEHTSWRLEHCDLNAWF